MKERTETIGIKAARVLMAVVIMVMMVLPITGCNEKIIADWEFCRITCHNETLVDECNTCPRDVKPEIEITSNKLKVTWDGGNIISGKWTEVTEDEYLIRGDSGSCDIRIKGDYLIITNVKVPNSYWIIGETETNLGDCEIVFQKE